MSHLESNLSVLSNRQPDLANLLRTVEDKRVKVFASVRGGVTASYNRGTSEISLHSRYEPMREARQILDSTDCTGANYYILFGFGLGYLLEAVIEKGADPSHHYFIVESDLEILKAAFEARDLRKILLLPHLHFAWPVFGQELSAQWMKFIDPVRFQKSVYLTHLPSVSLDPGLFKTAAEIIRSQTFQVFTDINTLVEKSRTFLDNFVQNICKAASAPGVIRFARKFSETPAVIVSAGPSLDKNIHELRGWEDQILILSTDTALKPLLAAGIEPHFILTGDPYYLNYRHMEGISIGNSLVVAETTSYPEVFNQFENHIISCTYDNSSLRSLSDMMGNKGILRAWGSVATMAMDFALLLECNPIIFIGQDLAHTDDRIYCSGICFEDEWYDGVTEPGSWQQKIIELRSQRRTVITEDVFGRSIESANNLIAYWNWMLKEIQNNSNVQFINATEGGILKGGLEIISLREAMHRYCRERRQLRERIDKVFQDSQSNNLHYSNLEVSVLFAEVSSIEKILAHGLRLCGSKIKLSSQVLWKRLEDAKKGIYINSHIAPLLDCLNQMGNVAFLRQRNNLKDDMMDQSLISEIRGIYSEYFKTVHKALDTVNIALKQIQKNLGFS